MEPAAAAWGPCEYQMANWTVEELAASDEVWAPAAGLPAEYASIDIYPSIWSLQPYVPSSSSGRQQQLVAYNYYAAATQYDDLIFEKAAAAPPQESFEVDFFHDREMEIYNNNPIGVFVVEEAARNLEDDINMMKMKIHRYPPGIQGMGNLYTVPRIVAIGPYHHGKRELKHAEKVKHAAAKHCIKTSGRSFREMYNEVVSVVREIDAHRLYDNDVMEGIGNEKFQHMMFFDACFLVMYMLKTAHRACDMSLYDYLEFNKYDIAHDIMLLENQIPWLVVVAIMRYTSVPLVEFITNWKKDGFLRDLVVDEVSTIVLDDSYEPPHLLGLLRFYIVGKRRRKAVLGLEGMKSIAVSVSAIELAQMGIKLTPNETTELADMGLTKKWIYFGKLSMAPLSLNDLRASLLVNMAAHELCTVPDFLGDEAGDEDSAVCSYLLLLCMLIHNEKDVEPLRTSGILQGAGLTDKQVLDFLASLRSVPLGRCSGSVMVQIQSYKNKRSMRIKVYAFFYNNLKVILGVGSTIGLLLGILQAIKSLRGTAH